MTTLEKCSKVIGKVIVNSNFLKFTNLCMCVFKDTCVDTWDFKKIALATVDTHYLFKKSPLTSAADMITQNNDQTELSSDTFSHV